jgi:hypothetical protein
MDAEGLSGIASDDDSETLTGAERVVDPSADTREVRSCERPDRTSSTRSAPCGVLPLLAAEVCVLEADRSGVSLPRDPGVIKLPISDLSGENRETKIGISLPYQTL